MHLKAFKKDSNKGGGSEIGIWFSHMRERAETDENMKGFTQQCSLLLNNWIKNELDMQKHIFAIV